LVSEFHKVARGNPGQCMAIAQHLLDTGVIQYSSGTWVLPSALHAADLPSTAQDTITCQIAGLSSAAQLLAQCQALAFYDSLSRSDYHALCPTVDKITVERALSELIAAQALVGDGKHFVLANRVWVQALHTPLDAATLRQRHDALAEMYRPHSDIALTYHLFAAGRDADGLAALQQRHLEYAQGVDYKKIVEQNISKLTPTYASAIAAAERLGRSAREVNELRRWFVAVCSSSEANYYWHAAPAWLEQLAHDSGLAFWRDDADNPDASARLFGALQRAQERYVATPEAARVYSVEEAIRLLAEYVVFSIAVGARTLNSELLSSLPDVIAPFAPLSPLLEAIWLNARATYDCNIVGDDDAARARWNTVLEKLEAHKGALPHLEAICSAVSLGVGMMEAQMGLESAVTWAARIEQDPVQRLAALQLRKIVRLTQGDWNGADKLRREAELYALHSPAQQMFQWLLTVELDAYAYARDLAGLTQVAEQLKAWAARYSGWLPFVHIAEACFHVVRGDYAAAKLGFEHCLELAAPSTNGAGLGHSRRVQVWLGAHAGLADVLLELGDAVSAERYARSGLEYCEQRGLHSRSFELSRMLALTEAKQGRFESASERLAQLVAAMKTLGTSGLRLGMAYEARALVAAWQSAAGDFEHYARVTAQEYRYAAGCPLGVRYERLLNEATRCGLRRAPELSDFAPADLQASRSQEVRNVYSMVLRTLTGATRSEERAQRSLQLICDLSGCASGHLYLVRPNGLQLAASVGSDPPHARASLQAAVQAELAQCARADAEDLETRLVTSVDHDAPSQRRTVTIEEVDYELLPLSCLQDASIVQVGMIALCVGGEAAERAAIVEQPLLLATIAAQLARAQVSLTPTRKR
ncbi:MAG: MalT-like region, partial [Pseudomonadota bacterium]